MADKIVWDSEAPLERATKMVAERFRDEGIVWDDAPKSAKDAIVWDGDKKGLFGAASSEPSVLLEQVKGFAKSATNAMIHGADLGSSLLTDGLEAPIRKAMGVPEMEWSERSDQMRENIKLLQIHPGTPQEDFDKALGEISKMSRSGTKALLMKAGVPEPEAELASIGPELALAALGFKGVGRGKAVAKPGELIKPGESPALLPKTEVPPEVASKVPSTTKDPYFIPREETSPRSPKTQGEPVQGSLPLEPPFELVGEVNPFTKEIPKPAEQFRAMKDEARTNEIADLMRKQQEEVLKKAEMEHDFAADATSARWKAITEEAGFKKIAEENRWKPEERKGKDIPETSMGLAMKEALAKERVRKDIPDVEGPSPLPMWLREELERKGIDPGRTFNDIDLGNRTVVEAIKADPTLTAVQKDHLLKTGSLKPHKGRGTTVEMFTLQPKMGAPLFERVLKTRFPGILSEATASLLARLPEDSKSIVKIMPVDAFEALYTLKGFGEVGKPPGPGPFSKITLTDVAQVAVRYDGLGRGYRIENYSGQHLPREYANYGHKEMPVIVEDLTGSLRKDNPRTLLGMGGERFPNPLYREDVKPSGLSSVKGTKVDMFTLQPGMANWRRFFNGVPRPEGVGTTLTERLVGASMEATRDFVDRMARELSTLGSKAFRVPLGLSSASYRVVNAWARNMGNQLYETALHFDSRLKDAFRFEHSLNAVLKPGYVTLGKLYNASFRDSVNSPIWKRFRDDMKILLEMERDPSAWRQGNEWYPTAIQLEQMGLSPEAATTWKLVFDGMERTWTVLEATLGAAGVKAPARVPGYLPHHVRGPYRIEVYRDVPAPTARDPLAMKREYSHEFGSFSRRESNTQFREIQNTLRGNPSGWIPWQREVSPHANKVQEMIEGLDRAQSIQQIAGAMTKLVEAVYESAAKGIIGSALERAATPKGGHLLERTQYTNPDSPFTLSRSQLVEALKAMQTTTEAVNGWSARVKFVTETLFPLEQGGLLADVSLKKAMRKYMHSYMKISDTVWKNLDAWIKDKFLAVGLDPGLAHTITEHINSGFAKVFLYGNVPFYTVNVMQSTVVLPVLLSKQAFGHAVGERVGNINTALKDMYAYDWNHIMRMDMQGNPILKWAQDNGYVTPQFLEHLDPGKLKDPIAKGIDERTRAAAFMTSFRYYDQIMPREKALRAAGETANEVGVPYSQQIGAPTLLSQLPQPLRPLAIFATFQQHMLGMLNNQLSMATLGVKHRNPQAVVKAAQAALSLQAMNVALYGLGGSALIVNWDDAARFVNHTFNTAWTTTTELSRSLDKTLGTGGLFQFGAISSLVGYDVSTSASGVGAQLPGAGAKMYGSIVEVGILSGKWLLRKDPLSKQEQWDVARTLPQTFAGPIEILIRNDAFNTAALPNVYQKGIERTKLDQWVRGAIGVRSTEEKAYLASERITEMKEARLSREMAQLSDLIRDKGFTKENTARVTEMAEKYQKDPDTFITSFLNFMAIRDLTPNQRRALPATNSPAAARLHQEYLKERSLEPNQGVNQ